MSIRSHRIVKVIYDDNTMSFQTGDEIYEAIISHGEGCDHTNMDGGGIIEIPLSGLKEILKDKKSYSFNKEQIIELKAEIKRLTDKGINDDEYISYDMF